ATSTMLEKYEVVCAQWTTSSITRCDMLLPMTSFGLRARKVGQLSKSCGQSAVPYHITKHLTSRARVGTVARFIHDRIYEAAQKQISAKALSTAQSSLRYSRLGEACRSQFCRPFCEVHP